MPSIKFEQLQQKEAGESSAEIRKRVNAARLKQHERYKRIKVISNAQLRSRHFEKYCPLSTDAYFGRIRTLIPETSGQRFGIIRTS